MRRCSVHSEINRWSCNGLSFAPISELEQVNFNAGTSNVIAVESALSDNKEVLVCNEGTPSAYASVMPRPDHLRAMSLEELRKRFQHLPEHIRHLVDANSAESVISRYHRVYQTLLGTHVDLGSRKRGSRSQ